APIARHQRSSTQLTSLLINNAGALGYLRRRICIEQSPQHLDREEYRSWARSRLRPPSTGPVHS
ncbi:hypothetical protein OSI29_24585, partial [Mycobacterium ulcerans]|nr:hypothetical protein [Mycobacterium ulcerans]MEB4029496.1 hypothetical protein [Mycobacterium ulcerans]MEB4046038.1 hypothetical protein [Mycobacterium ulcerans]MEB4058464.1 hypothetical protein [Mycobacterium ulcerans]MEB4095678.1 hypothetical protein [Mycobacterium ulcerans]